MVSEIRFLLVGEDFDHFRAVERLVDRILVEGVAWIGEEIVAEVRCWLPFGGDRFLSSTAAFKLARDRGLKIYGKFDGKPGFPDAATTRAALLLAASNEPTPEIVVIARDRDGEEERRRGITQACAAVDWPFLVILALPEPEIEAWLIAGFIPENEAEEETIKKLHSELGFDPTHAPHRLRSTSHGSPKDAKRVLTLLAPEPERQSRCLDAPLEHLRQEKYAETGLFDFLGELQQKLLPVAHKA